MDDGDKVREDGRSTKLGLKFVTSRHATTFFSSGKARTVLDELRVSNKHALETSIIGTEMSSEGIMVMK